MAADVLDPAQIEEVFADGVDLGDPFIVLALAQLAVERLRHADTSDLDDEGRRHFARGVESLRNQADAAAVEVARQVDAAGHERRLGYFTTAGWSRHHLRLSTTEARVRMQVVRMLDALPSWQRAARNGQIGLEHLRIAARTFALTAVQPAFVELAEQLLADAIGCSFEGFEERLANLRRLADAAGERTAARRRHDARHVSIRRLPDGSWRVSGRLGDVQGAEINDIVAHFYDAEWRSDWADAQQRLGPDAEISSDDLRRTEAQRRADAFHQVAMLAAANPGDGRGPLPALNVLIDWETFTTELSRADHRPERYRDIVCRTQAGDPLPLAEASSMALYAHLRRVVLQSPSAVIDLGRRRRLFTGAARDAVMLTESTCIWFGCDAPIRRAHADHNVEWRLHGTTSPGNGGPMCVAHNLLKERMGYRIWRDADGEWQITDRNGTPLG